MSKISMQHRARLTRLATPQVERNPGTRLLVRTNAPVWPATEWERLDRFLIFGSERGTYFMRARQLTVESAKDVLTAIAADGPRVVRRIVELSAMGRVMSNDTLVFALALAAAFGNEATRTMALEAVPEVVRDGSGCEAVAAWHAAASHTLALQLAIAG